ncbi:MAG: hypothetical protein ABIZ64_02995 [Casimicrobium sp.]
MRLIFTRLPISLASTVALTFMAASQVHAQRDTPTHVNGHGLLPPSAMKTEGVSHISQSLATEIAPYG